MSETKRTPGPVMTPEERAKRVMFGDNAPFMDDDILTASHRYVISYPQLVTAIRDAVKVEREACELIAMRYRDKMAHSASERRHDGLPTDVAVSKFDAADAIAAAIRERPL